jgi:hypothetical protein
MSHTAFMNRLQQLDRTLTRQQLKQVVSMVEDKHMGSIDIQECHTLIASRFGRDKESLRPSSVVERVKAKIVERSRHTGFKALQRSVPVQHLCSCLMPAFSEPCAR